MSEGVNPWPLLVAPEARERVGTGPAITVTSRSIKKFLFHLLLFTTENQGTSGAPGVGGSQD